MTKLKPKDIVFNYRKGFIIGFCEIKTEYFLAPQPDEFDVDVQWENKGYMIDADYVLFAQPIDIESAYNAIYQYLPKKYSPLNNSHLIMKKRGYSWRFKLVAIVLSLVFTSTTLNTIDSHAYTTGVNNYHISCGCFGCWPSHINYSCDFSYNKFFL